MVEPVTVFLVSVACLLVAGAAARPLAERTGVPEALWLVAVGALLRATGLASAETITALAPFFAALALVIVLFEAGRDLRFRAGLAHGGRARRLALAGAGLAVPAVMLLSMALSGLNLLPKTHIVERYMATVAHLGARYDGKGLDFFIPENQEIKLADLSPHLSPGNYVALVLGATHATKRMPKEKIAALIRLIDAPVVLLGGKAEAETGRWIGAQSGIRVIDTCGQLSLLQSASVVAQAGKVVTHDTGLMHIAAALGKDIVSIWGSTIPGFGMYPFLANGKGSNVTMEVEGLRCRPCSKIGHERCPKGHFRCMNLLDENALARAASLHLDEKN